MIINKVLNSFYPKYTSKSLKKTINKLWKELTTEEKKELYDEYDRFNKDLVGKEDVRVLKDMLLMNKKYRFRYEEYFMFNFKDMLMLKRRTFIPAKDMKAYIASVNDPNDKKALRDKYSCYLMYKKYYKRDMIKVSKDSDYKEFEAFVKKHPVFVKKPYNKAFGNGVELIDSKKYKTIKSLYNELSNLEDAVVLEEKIIQSKEMSVLNSSSVNTVRMIPFIKSNGEVIIHLPFLRIGMNNAFVDNGGSGGLIVRINPKTGKTITNGFNELREEFIKHPDTDVVLKGFQIPKWDEAVSLAKELVVISPTLRYIGWDMALTDNGWVIVEGNGATQFIGQQMTECKGRKKEFEKLINFKK